MEKKSFGKLPSGEKTTLYTISDGKVTAQVTDYGASLSELSKLLLFLLDLNIQFQ